MHDVPEAERCPAWAEPGGGAREGDGFPLAAACFRVQRVPNDGECLFSAVAFCDYGDSGRGPALREAAVKAVVAAPAMLGEGGDREAYAARMRKPETWAGEVELAALATHLAIDVGVASLVDPPGAALKDYSGAGAAAAAAPPLRRRCYLVYTGTHYDAIKRFDDGAAFADAGADESVRRLADALRAVAAKPKTWVGCSPAEGGCGNVMEAAEFEAHCGAVAHGDDFMMMAEPAEAPAEDAL